TAEDRRPVLEQAGLTLEIQTPQIPVWQQGDPMRLAQVFDNLLDNAAKYTGPGGRVSVRLDLDPDRRQAVVRVADTGMGIDPKVLPLLFQPFAQGGQGLERAQGGLGLGLSVVKGLVELHGGQVAAGRAGPAGGAELIVR